jgi:hypothetical protein
MSDDAPERRTMILTCCEDRADGRVPACRAVVWSCNRDGIGLLAIDAPGNPGRPIDAETSAVTIFELIHSSLLPVP